MQDSLSDMPIRVANKFDGLMRKHSRIIILDQKATTSEHRLPYDDLAVRQFLYQRCHQLRVVLLDINQV
jgi:hypothetical protein